MVVEHIQKVELVVGEGGTLRQFVYPPAFCPKRHSEDAFGIMVVEERPVAVEVLIHNEETGAYLRARKIHRTQQFHRRPDGKTVLSVRGTTEVRNWVLNFGPWLEVLKPPQLARRGRGFAAPGFAQLQSFQSRAEARAGRGRPGQRQPATLQPQLI